MTHSESELETLRRNCISKVVSCMNDGAVVEPKLVSCDPHGTVKRLSIFCSKNPSLAWVYFL